MASYIETKQWRKRPQFVKAGELTSINSRGRVFAAPVGREIYGTGHLVHNSTWSWFRGRANNNFKLVQQLDEPKRIDMGSFDRPG